jgi:hypothetical protein
MGEDCQTVEENIFYRYFDSYNCIISHIVLYYELTFEGGSSDDEFTCPD